MRRNSVITAIIFTGMVLLGVFVFSDSYLRLWESLRDLGSSAAYYFACPCIVGDEVRVHIPHGSKLTMQGGRSLESALKGAYDRASAIQVKTFTVTQE